MLIENTVTAVAAGLKFLVTAGPGFKPTLAREADSVQVPGDGFDLRVCLLQVMDLGRCLEILHRMFGQDYGRHFVTADMTRCAGVSSVTLDKWIQAGIIVPELPEGRGRGNRAPRQFTHGDLLAAAVAGSLSRRHVALDAIREAVAVVRAGVPAEKTTARQRKGAACRS